jgi:hypothetical protein
VGEDVTDCRRPLLRSWIPPIFGRDPVQIFPSYHSDPTRITPTPHPIVPTICSTPVLYSYFPFCHSFPFPSRVSLIHVIRFASWIMCTRSFLSSPPPRLTRRSLSCVSQGQHGKAQGSLHAHHTLTHVQCTGAYALPLPLYCSHPITRSLALVVRCPVCRKPHSVSLSSSHHTPP